MSVETLMKTVHATRGYFLGHVKDLSPEQLTQYVQIARHNILWNIGHIVYTSASILYGPAGLEPPIPPEYGGLFKGGTSPKDWTVQPDIGEVMAHFKRQNKIFQEDYAAGKFARFQRRELAPGYAVESVEDALAFNLFHEGIHAGMVAKLRQMIGAGH